MNLISFATGDELGGGFIAITINDTSCGGIISYPCDRRDNDQDRLVMCQNGEGKGGVLGCK